MKDISIKKYEDFILLDSMWKDLDFPDVSYRLGLLTEYFCRMAGYRIQTMLGIAWNRRFSSEYEGKKDFQNFVRAVKRNSQRSRTPNGSVSLTDTLVYEQFEIALSEKQRGASLLPRPALVEARHSLPEKKIRPPITSSTSCPVAQKSSGEILSGQGDEIDSALSRLTGRSMQNRPLT